MSYVYSYSMSLIQHSLVGHEHVKKWPYIISFVAKSGLLRFIYLALFFSLALLGESLVPFRRKVPSPSALPSLISFEDMPAKRVTFDETGIYHMAIFFTCSWPTSEC
jgi:hypothetical protein